MDFRRYNAGFSIFYPNKQGKALGICIQMKGPVLACTVLFIRLKLKKPKEVNLHVSNIQFLFFCSTKSAVGFE